MKLYATVNSERASKGQGGNQYIDIKLVVGNKHNQIEVGIVRLRAHADGYTLALDRTSNFRKEGGRVYEEFLAINNCTCAYHDDQGNCTDTPN